MEKSKLKELVSDWFKKNLDDETTRKQMARIIGKKKGIDHSALFSETIPQRNQR